MDRNIYRASEADAARKAEDWGSLTWLASQKIGNADGLTLGFVVIKQGKSNPRHAHMTCEEALTLRRGRLEHSIGDRKVIVEAGDTLTIPAGVFHNAVSIGAEEIR